MNGKKFNDLELPYKRAFWDYILVVDFIESIEGTNIEEVFDRVNRNSINLQPQELRHAKFNGWFINVSEKEAEKDFWWDIKVSTRAKDKRMKNVQLIAELLLINLENKIVGFSQDYLDEMYAQYDIPEETVDDFDEDSFWKKTDKVKTYLVDMNNHNSCISEYAKTANNLYTIWALVSLNSTLPDSKELAKKYTKFMKEVDLLSNGLYEDLIASNNDRPDLEQQMKYFINSKGASTDFTQRNTRLSCLQLELLANENS